ncbi:MAG: lipoprotein [Betaproteobacteria bacterium]|nr:lipoprotein [Betaproteobacteria bacterium]
MSIRALYPKLALLAVLVMLSSCGQKGALYFRDSPPPGVRPERPIPEKPTPYPSEPTQPGKENSSERN